MSESRAWVGNVLYLGKEQEHSLKGEGSFGLGRITAQCTASLQINNIGFDQELKCIVISM